MSTLIWQDPREIRLQRPMALRKNARGHDLDETVVRLPSLGGTRLPNGRRYLTDLLARKETDSSFAVQKDSCLHQLS